MTKKDPSKDPGKDAKWREDTAKKNMAAATDWAAKQDKLEADGYTYNNNNGLWTRHA